MRVKISNGNSKMGNISSVSLPSVVTCRTDVGCSDKCYARKIERIRKSVRDAYQSNYDLLRREPDVYWREVEASIMMSRFFRFHVSGDIPDGEYFSNMIDIASRNPHCDILCFTKKFDIVNQKIDKMNEQSVSIPKNLHIIFSGWKGLEMENPYNLPEAHVKYKDGTTTARDGAKKCPGNCSECAITDDGCWTLAYGEQVVFDEH